MIIIDKVFKFKQIVHYVDDNVIVSTNRNIVALDYSTHIIKYKVPMPWYFVPFTFSRLTSRFFRLVNINISLVSKQSQTFMLIYQGSVYKLTKNGVFFIFKMKNGKALLHNSIALTPYGIFFGEYVNSKTNINIYKVSLDMDMHQIVYTFDKGDIRHVHSCSWDTYENMLWILTGDTNKESKIIKATHDFDRIETIGGGSQDWRSVSILFKKDEVYWFMDSPIRSSHLIKYNRHTKEIEKLYKFPGPVWYVLELSDGGYLLSTIVEPGEGVTSDNVHIYFSLDLKSWVNVLSVKKDIFPSTYFKYGVILFAQGKQTKGGFYFSTQSVSKMDGRSYKCHIELS